MPTQITYTGAQISEYRGQSKLGLLRRIVVLLNGTVYTTDTVRSLLAKLVPIIAQAHGAPAAPESGIVFADSDESDPASTDSEYVLLVKILAKSNASITFTDLESRVTLLGAILNMVADGATGEPLPQDGDTETRRYRRWLARYVF